MTPHQMAWRSSLRVVTTIAAKDITDALRNKTTLTTIGTVLFLLVMYQFLPAIGSSTMNPRLVFFDETGSGLGATLEGQETFDVYVANSRDSVEAYVVDKDFPVLGLVWPAGLREEGPVRLDGYMARWYDDEQILETGSFFEEALSQATGRAVTIDLSGGLLYSRSDSRGRPFLIALSLVMALTMVGIIMTVQLIVEEKQAKTLDALLVSPATPGQVILGKALTGLFYSLIACGFVLLINGDMVGRWWLAILVVLVGSLFAVGIGLLLGSAVETISQQRLWTFILFQPLLIPVFLSMMDDILPATVIQVFRWIPTVALSAVARASFALDAPLSHYGPQLALVAAWAAALLVAAAWFVRRTDR